MVLTQISCMKPAGGAADVENDCFQINMNGINRAGITVISVSISCMFAVHLTTDLQVSSDLRQPRPL